jgi:hypothetical protein
MRGNRRIVVINIPWYLENASFLAVPISVPRFQRKGGSPGEPMGFVKGGGRG